jgi:hypothetical protein
VCSKYVDQIKHLAYGVAVFRGTIGKLQAHVVERRREPWACRQYRTGFGRSGPVVMWHALRSTWSRGNTLTTWRTWCALLEVVSDGYSSPLQWPYLCYLLLLPTSLVSLCVVSPDLYRLRNSVILSEIKASFHNFIISHYSCFSICIATDYKHSEL